MASYIFYYRTLKADNLANDRSTRFALDPQTARAEAQRLLGGSPRARILRPQSGPSVKPSVAELCDLCFADAEAGRVLTRL